MKESIFVTRIISKHIADEELKGLLITHSRCVAEKALKVADKGGNGGLIDRQFLYDAAMLHDIGVVECDAPSIYCYGTNPYITHGIRGGAILRSEGLDERYCRVCERHTGAGLTAEEIRESKLPLPLKDFLPETLEEKLICYADKFYSKSSNPKEEKTRDRIERSLKRHGDKVWQRFETLESTLIGKTNDAD